MNLFQTISSVVLIQVLFMSVLTYAGDDDCEGQKGPIRCYECSSEAGDRFCGDPFNDSLASTRVIKCDEGTYCVKWWRRPHPGVITYVRTCSTELKINMRISNSCFEESRPATGEICFCDKHLCNNAPPPSVHYGLVISLATITATLLTT